MKTNLLKSIFISLILVMGVSNANAAYNQSAKDLYFDNSEAKWNSCYVYIGHGTWTSVYPLTRVSGTQYLWQLAKADFNGGGSWNGATGWVLCYEKWWDSKGESIDKYTWHGDKNVTQKSTSAWVDTKIYKTNGTASTKSDNHTINAYKVTSYTKSNYTVTINTVEGGTLTVKDYDDQAVATGASKIHLTVLKFSATPASGYVLDGVEINDGSTTTTIAAADLATTTHTLKSAVTITPVWHATTSTVTVTATATNGTVTGGGVVEEGTSVTLTATPADGYKFVNWTVGGAEVSTANPYTFTADADVEVVANFEELPKTTVYFVNTHGWANVKAYAYSPANASWPGVDATLEAEKIGDFDVYSYTATEGKYANVIFNGNGGQTADLTWSEGVDKYYIHGYNGNTGWYTKAEAEAILVVPVEYEYVYLINTNDWAKAHIYTWTPEVAGWPGAAMTKEAEQIAGKDVYSYKVVKGTTFGGMNFNCGGDECKTGDLTWQAGKYYAPSKDKWYDDAAAAEAGLAPDPLATGVYLAGDMTNKDNWDVNKKEFKKETAEATTASVTVTLAAQTYKFKLVVGGAWKGNTGTMQRGGVAVHEGGWSFDKDGYDDNCQIVADIAGDYTFTWNLETKKLTVTYPELPTYTVTATAENGTVTGAGEYKHGTEATLVATPNAGYAFVNWKKGEEVVSSEASYTFTVTANTDLIAVFAPEETHEVTVSYLCNSNPIPGHDATTLAVGVTTPSTITAPAITHYTFDSWTVGTGVQAVDAKANPIQITTKAEGDYTLAANYTKIELTYTVTVPEGTEKCYIAGDMNSWSFTEMTPQGNNVFSITIDGATDAHKYKYACQESWDYVEKQANGEDVGDRTYSANDKVAKWADPLATNVYLAGTMNGWSTNTLEFKKPSTKDDTIASVTLKNLDAGTYQFKIIVNGEWLGNTGTMKRGGDGVHEGGWSFNETGGDEKNCKIVADIAGEYTFTWNINAKKLTVTYPTKDYRLVYVESASGEAPYTIFHTSQPIHYQIAGEKLDTISFFINKEGQNPAILLQQCEVDNGSATWNTIATQSINGVQGGDPGQAKAPTKRAPELKIGNGFPNIESSGVYNFVLEQTNNNAEHNAQILSQETHAYVGNYYIRTDAAEGGWNNYKTTPNNIMTYSQNVHGNYDYYFCAWVLKDQNVKYVVANDYSYCVSDTLADDDIVTNIYGNLPANANVRYTWNSQTNALERAYLAGSGNISDRYLVLVGDKNLKDLEGNTFDIDGLNEHEANFKDMDNWLYQLDIKANKNTLVKLTADYNGKTQYFNNKGSADSTKQLIKGNDTTYYALRLIYDFKTNYLVSGLVGNQTITSDLELEEVMIVRSHHDEAQTLKISNGRVTANKAYGVMTFNKDTLNDNTKSQYERALYWVSFPFDVQLDKVFGFGNYGEHWIMEYYDGAERAEKGLWKEPTYSYWKYITNPNDTLEAGKGYVLCLNLDLLDNNTAFWDHGNTEIALYFPSDGQNAIVIDNNPAETTTKVDAHTCTIERDNRDIEDSNWNIIGVPAYTKIAEINSQNLNFYYQYIAGDDPETKDIDETNSYRVQDEPTFNTMHAYMVQFAGEINWMEKVVSLAAIAARKSPASKDQYTLRLALQQEGADHDHTFIRLQEDKATAEFDMNYDLCKIINRGANIYSMINDVEVAANVLPVEERVIPIGLDIHETGNYTFAMPDGTDGITAILIDYETGKETNLLLADYTTELREGTNNGRFALRVRPNHVATAVETIIDGANGQIQKYIINGALYILNNGQLYDAQGRMVQP